LVLPEFQKIFCGTFHTKNEGWDLNMLSRSMVGKTFLSWDPILQINLFGCKKVEIVRVTLA
jgi:hypothetical protein